MLSLLSAQALLVLRLAVDYDNFNLVGGMGSTAAPPNIGEKPPFLWRLVIAAGLIKSPDSELASGLTRADRVPGVATISLLHLLRCDLVQKS